MPGQRDSRTKTVKFKGKRQMRQGPTSMPAQRQGVQQAQPGFNVLQEEPESGSLVDQIEFEQRLKALKVRRAVLRLHVRLPRGLVPGQLGSACCKSRLQWHESRWFCYV